MGKIMYQVPKFTGSPRKDLHTSDGVWYYLTGLLPPVYAYRKFKKYNDTFLQMEYVQTDLEDAISVRNSYIQKYNALLSRNKKLVSKVDMLSKVNSELLDHLESLHNTRSYDRSPLPDG